MKTTLAILAAAFVSTALADKHSDDYWQFEKWLQYVHQEAPRRHLKLTWGEPTQEEWFYLYCWQGDDHSIIHAIRKAKKAWQQTIPWRERIYANDNTYDQWMDWYNTLPREARRYPGADKAYWKLWYQRGFSPEFAWKNTDPTQTHTFSRPKLRNER